MTTISKKQQYWDEVRYSMAKVTDKLGMPIDQGIFETVVAFNVLGINTSMSCEGHLDHGRAAPWIRFQTQEMNPVQAQAKEAVQYLQRAKEEHAPAKEIEKLTHEMFRLSREAGITCFQEPKRIMDYLEIFYRDRLVPYDRQLMLKVDSFGTSMLTVHGEPFQFLHSSEIRQQKLLAYQEEMRTFTAYLKQIYSQA
jgi:hypothetical protein